MALPPRDRRLRKPLAELAARDPDFAMALEQVGLPRERKQQPGFPGLVRIIVAQQLSIHAARTISGRLEAALDPFTPETFLARPVADLRGFGLSNAKVRYTQAIARHVVEGHLDFDRLHGADDDTAMTMLTAIDGIGPWTAEIYLLFALNRPDIMPAGDLALAAALQRMKRLCQRPDPKKFRKIAESWRPYRSAAARFLWHYYAHAGIPA